MEAINYIKQYHKKYLGNIDNSYYDENNHNYNYYYNKYIYEFEFYNIKKDYNDEYDEHEEYNDIEIFYKNNICNRYDNIIIDKDDYKYEYDEYGIEINFLNNEIYIDNEFLTYFINNYKKYLYDDESHLLFKCTKIIINFNYELIQQLIINKNIIFRKFHFQANTLIFENGFFNYCECKDFICNSEKIINEFFDYITCYNFIINKNSINIKKLLIDNSIINNSIINNYHSIINKLEYNNYDLNNLNYLNKNYVIEKLIILYDDDIKIFNISNIKNICLFGDVILYDNFNKLNINYNCNITFNNFMINTLIVNIHNNLNNINNKFINLINLLINNNIPINNLIIKINKKYRQYILNKNILINFQYIKLNKLKIPNNIEITNIDNIKKIKYINYDK